MRNWMCFPAMVAALAGGGIANAQTQPVRQTSAATAASPAATVNGQPITEAMVQRALKVVAPEKHAEARPEVIEFLIDNMLVEQYLIGQKVAVDGAEVAKRIKEIQAEAASRKQDFNKQLQEWNLSQEELQHLITADLRWEKFALSRATDAALKAVFDQNTDIFDGTMVRARHILITPPANDAKAGDNARATLAAIKQEVAKAGADAVAKLPPTSDAATRDQARARAIEDAFARAAEKNSACPSKKQGGDVSWFPRSGSMVEPFAKTAFAMKPYDISDPVSTQFGYHLILVVGRRAGQPVTFEKAKEGVKDYFCGKLRENLCMQLRQSAKITMGQGK